MRHSGALGTTLDDHTLALLEFPAVLERAARHATCAAGRDLVRALRPSIDRATVVQRQRETGEAVWLLGAAVDLGAGGAPDVRLAAEAAGRGAVLPPQQLLEIVQAVRAAERIRRTLARVATDVPLLAETGASIPDLHALRVLIEQSIDERGEVLDGASTELTTIRRELTGAHDRLQQRMEHLLRSTDLRTALQDAIITLREGRYVFPVRAEARSTVPGVVHDTSSSGATVYIEPLAVVDLGNRWRELQLQEAHEVQRVLRDLGDAVGQVAGDLVAAVECTAHVDAAMARARFATEIGATALARADAEQPWLLAAPAPLHLIEARHPLLDGHVVPITIAVGEGYHALLITGPNTGGKTVALKTAGLLTLMALAGLPIPVASGSTVPVYDSVFADIGDEQSIEQSLSTFSGHVSAIIDILERATDRSLVLLDELGAGTDPTEGAALGIAVVDRLVAAHAQVIATTHHSELKIYAHETPGVRNASVEFDLDTLTPTYRLTIGLPGQSNALAIAERLGMPADVIGRARAGLAGEARDLERVLAELRAELTTAQERAALAAEAQAHAEAFRTALADRLAALEAETAELRERTHRELREEVQETTRLVARTRRQVESARLEQASADLARAQQAAAALPPAPPPRAAQPTIPRDRRPTLLPGRTVWLRGVPSPGEILTAPDDRGEFDVQLGALRTRARTQQVLRTARPSQRERAVRLPAPPTDAPPELDVRGQTVTEALPTIESYIDQAARSGRVRVLVVHGKGSGTLRLAVRELLAQHPLVQSHETGLREEGGEGVTVVYLASPQP